MKIKNTFIGGFTEMKKAKFIGISLVALSSVLLLAACGGKKSTTSSTASSSSSSNHSVALVTDIGGVDDRSFNQSAWEGLQEWGKKHDIKRGTGGYDYIQSDDATQYTTNVSGAVQNGFKTIFGIGYLLQPAIKEAAAQNPNVQFVIIDETIDADNVVSATFKDNEAAYLAGIAAAETTKTNKVGFIGGEEGVVIDRFQAGFEQGVADTAKKLGKTITVDSQYAASFGDPAKGKALAASMYQDGADIIFHASGGTGAGVFQEAKAINSQLNEADLDSKKVWVIGVDSDQADQGKYTTKDGKDDNFTLASTLKGVGAAVEDISTRALEGKFPGGEHLEYGLKDGGVDITDGYLSDDAKSAIKEAKQEIIDGKIEVPETPSK
ncbi:basic membrane protein [Enterococcus italicus DSM 15952]|uniref:Basic membrane protein n=2 Tax=Enterococcus italicus TaxID=246144 RepID=E6LE37_ENTI1|nr:basic membrane protein [Enterococcus italicus DSM 15952]OJG57265.1 membrane protein [Enterococcus italicus DSM 15952]